jgi:hypothetical protein
MNISFKISSGCPTRFNSNGDHGSYIFVRRKTLDIGESSRRTVPGIAIRAPSDAGIARITECAHSGEMNHRLCDIDTCGWTFQRRYLSPRNLRLTSSEMGLEGIESHLTALLSCIRSRSYETQLASPLLALTNTSIIPFFPLPRTASKR